MIDAVKLEMVAEAGKYPRLSAHVELKATGTGCRMAGCDGDVFTTFSICTELGDSGLGVFSLCETHASQFLSAVHCFSDALPPIDR